MTLRRAAQPASRILRDVRRAGGFTQINHPTIFPSANPLFALLCRGCPWDYSAQETDYRLVDAIEVNTGPQKIGEAPNPFTTHRDRLLRAGARRAARTPPRSASATRTTPGAPTARASRRSGIGATAVYAKELSEKGIRCAVKAGHTYAKIGGAVRPGPALHGPRARARASGRSSATPPAGAA